MYKRIILLLFALATGLTPALAVTPQGLQQEIDAGTRLTIIDIRPNAVYRKSHIQNAINIPANLIGKKRLPPLGRVVIYNDGIDLETLDQAVAALNTKPGIQAEALEGGFTAWSSGQKVIQRKSGLGSSQIKSITYQTLVSMVEAQQPLALVDLRAGDEQEALADHFPGVPVVDPIHDVRENTKKMEIGSEILSIIPKQNLDVLILIDDGDGLADRVAEKLHAAGTKRLAILIGGERALEVRGIPTETVRSMGE